MTLVTNPAVSPEENDPSVFAITPTEVRRLAQLVEENGLSELLIEAGDLKIVLRTAAFQPPSPVLPVGNVPFAPTPPPLQSIGTEHEEDFVEPEEALLQDTFRLRPIEAPLMGVFYRASSQGSPPLVEIGDLVVEGQIIGLIEAMKVFSEIPSPVGGRVTEIPARNGALVQPGDTLILLETE